MQFPQNFLDSLNSYDVNVRKACTLYTVMRAPIKVLSEAYIHLSESCANSVAYCFTCIPWSNERKLFAQHLRTTWRANAFSRDKAPSVTASIVWRANLKCLANDLCYFGQELKNNCYPASFAGNVQFQTL